MTRWGKRYDESYDETRTRANIIIRAGDDRTGQDTGQDAGSGQSELLWVVITDRVKGRKQVFFFKKKISQGLGRNN